MTEIRVTRVFEKLLRRLAPNIAEHILTASQVLKDSPLAGKLLRGYYEVRVEDQVIRARLRSLRVGDYRVIYWYDVREDVVWLLLVGHRKWIYKKLT